MTTQQQREHRLAKRARGECGRNGCHEVSGKRYYCTAHEAKNRELVKRCRGRS